MFAAVVIGIASLILLVAAVADADWLFRLGSSRMWVAVTGRSAARVLFVVFGLIGLVGSGVLAAVGSPNGSSGDGQEPTPPEEAGQPADRAAPGPTRSAHHCDGELDDSPFPETHPYYSVVDAYSEGPGASPPSLEFCDAERPLDEALSQIARAVPHGYNGFDSDRVADGLHAAVQGLEGADTLRFSFARRGSPAVFVFGPAPTLEALQAQLERQRTTLGLEELSLVDDPRAALRLWWD